MSLTAKEKGDKAGFLHDHFLKVLTFYEYWRFQIIIIFLITHLILLMPLLFWPTVFSKFNFKTFLLGLATCMLIFYPTMRQLHRSTIKKLEKNSRIEDYKTAIIFMFISLYIGIIFYSAETILLPNVLPDSIIQPKTFNSFGFGCSCGYISSFLLLLLLFFRWEHKTKNKLFIEIYEKMSWGRRYALFFEPSNDANNNNYYQMKREN